MTRARERLILSGGVDCERLPAPRPGGPPIDWIARALTRRPGRRRDGAGDASLERAWDGRRARLLCRLNAPATLGAVLPRAALPRPAAPAPARPAPRCRTPPGVLPEPPARPRPAPQRLSYSALGAYARCGYRFYLERVLRLPRVTPPPRAAEAGEAARPGSTRACAARSSTGCSRTSTSRARRCPTPRRSRALAGALGRRARPTPRSRTSARSSPRSPARRCARGSPAPAARRREAPFAFALEPAGGGPLVNGFLDVVAVEARRRRPDRRLQVRPARGRRRPPTSSSATTRPSGSSTRSPPCATAPRASRSPTASSSAPPSRSRAPSPPPTSPRSPSASPASPAACSRGATRSPQTPHRELCGDCPGRARCARGPERR